MGAKVQSKSHFPGSITDLNNGFCNGTWDLFHDQKILKIPGPGNSQHYDYFLTKQATDGYAKEQIRQTILKHESIFRHQLQELHRLYKRQTDLMNPVPTETSKFGQFLSQPPSERKVIDLDLIADVEESNKGKQKIGNFHSLSSEKPFNFTDLNEPIPIEDSSPFSASVSYKNTTEKHNSLKRTIFGVEMSVKTQKPSFDFLNSPTFRSSNPQSSNYLGQNGSVIHHNHWQNPSLFGGESRSLVFLNGIKSKDSVLGNNNNKFEEIRDREKRKFLDMWKNHEAPEPQQRLPPWLAKETPSVYHINLDSLQNHSQKFFKKAEIEDGSSNNKEKQDFKKVKIDDDSGRITKILGVPILDLQNSKDQENGVRKNQIDLNLSLDEEDESLSAPSFPESVVKIATMEIDLEAPVLESEPDFQETSGAHLELEKTAAETIVYISSSKSPKFQDSSAATLRWFAAVITSEDSKKMDQDFKKMDQESVPEGMDYFEFMTLKLQDSEESYQLYEPTIMEKEKDETGLVPKRTPRKGQGKRGRQKRDFQKDILPSIVSLSRREVTEDLQTFEEAFSGTGVSWQSSLSKRKGGRNRRQLEAVVPPPAAVVCREVALEKSLGGWGRRTRRLPRQRCGNAGNHHSLALKC